MSEHSSTLAVLLKRLEQATTRLEGLALNRNKKEENVETSKPKDIKEESESIKLFDEKVLPALDSYLKLSQSIGDVVAQHSEFIQAMVSENKAYLNLAAQHKKPISKDLEMELWKPSQQLLEKIENVLNANRASPLFNHLNTVAQGAPAFSWVLVEPDTANSVKDHIESAQFYAFRVIKEYKEKDPLHVEWANSYLKLLKTMYEYVNQYYKTGLTWNREGPEVGQSVTSPPPPPPKPASLKSSSNSSLPPPPPPAPLPSTLLEDKPSSIGNVFSEINRGENVTSNLKKVDKSMMTHKNPELKAKPPLNSTVVPPARSTARPSPGRVAPAKEAETKLEGNRWLVQYHTTGNITIKPSELKQVVYIFNCSNCTVQIQGKCNGVVLDTCKKTGVVLDTAMASVDVVNSQSCQVQVLKSTPTVVIDKTDGLQLYLSEEGLNTEITTAKSSQINILLPSKVADPKAEDDDFVERALPEQFKTTIKDGKLVTVQMDHE